MSTTTTAKGATRAKPTLSLGPRILAEGYGAGAWHGADLKAALADTPVDVAFWRPGPGRHHIAEIAVHHAWCARSVASRLSGAEPGAFPYQGEDWFEVPDGKRGWTEIMKLLETQQAGLAKVVAEIASGRLESPLPEEEQFALMLGVTCHAIYHAGQIQLLKVLQAQAA